MTIAITDVVLRDAHQSLFATRLRLDDMLPIAAQLDDVGYGSLECWGGATFDACIRFLGEDPWVRLRELKKAMPKTPLQMLLRGQNLLGYRHYADDVVERFVERAVKNGMDVFRVFDAMNDPRNMKAALQAVRSHGAHAQGTLSYTTSPAHTLQTWLDLTEQLLETGVDSIAIKDMSGILTPMAAYELVSEIKKRFEVRLHLHCHATTGMAEMTLLKAIEAGVDGVDTAISSMSATYGHPATEALVATLAGTEHDTGLDILKLESIAAYFREVRKKYHAFEGQLKGYDSRILVAQVPGGMLTNLESQLKQQNAADKLDQVLAEIPRVREDLGFIPLVTPTSQIVGTQAVLNVLTGERYKTIARETAGILKGEYGHTPVPVNAALQARVLEGGAPVTCRPADLLKPELAELEADVRRQAQEKGIQLAGNAIDDVLTVALFPQIGLKFLENRHNPAAFEPVPQAEAAQPVAKAEKPAASGVYTVEVEGKAFVVKVSDGGDISQLTAAVPAASSAPVQAAAPAGAGTPVTAPLLGMFCFGNLMRESGVVERLSDTVQNGLINIVTIFLGLSVGAKLVADKFLQPQTLGILLLGVVAFGIGTAAGVLMAKLLNLCSKNKINPLIGSAGVSAVPMAARVSNKVGLESDPQNFLLMHAMGPNVAGVIGSAIAAGVMLKYVLAM
ncbi:oxaloacetate decarboxylase subunit alpha [Salmonella enterica subsp. enterica]|nr:oxaloacetate decarboxylase subunit alpha [Salmonella enterica subsp. enterica]EAW1855957.1 oxaloacetate decarboxylase subunit alpha [Salmonella enterica subsp. enterica]EAW1862967.1 oxaloacetate decarboxylase subunit alpha [Salmonella enterica subsp. enterica]